MKYLLHLILITSIPCLSSELVVENTLFYKEGDRAYAVLDISWKNAFYIENANGDYYDAAWLFFRWVNNEKKGYFPIHVRPQGHSQVANGKAQVALKFDVSKDGMGVFISLANPGEKDISARIVVELETSDFEGINPRRQTLIPYAIEMIHVPEGPVTIGSPNTTAYGALYLSDSKERNEGPVSNQKGRSDH